jgi:hypothetical protein
MARPIRRFDFGDAAPPSSGSAPAAGWGPWRVVATQQPPGERWRSVLSASVALSAGPCVEISADTGGEALRLAREIGRFLNGG